MDSDESGHSENVFYYPEEETLNQIMSINLFPNFKKKKSKKINMLFTRLGHNNNNNNPLFNHDLF